jgi:hypothetical protein
LLIATALTTLVGCNSEPPPAQTKVTHISLTIPGRQIEASLEGGGTLDTSGDATVVVFGNHRLRIQQESLVLEGNPMTTAIAATAKRIDIVLSKGKLTVSADGKNVMNAPVVN